VLFASPSLRIPGILQSPFFDKIGGSSRVRDELMTAMTEGRGVTAKVLWVNRADRDEGRPRWIHCTPLLSGNGSVGVWMVVVIDDDEEGGQGQGQGRRRYRQAPPVVDPYAQRSNRRLSATDDFGGRPSTATSASSFEREERIKNILNGNGANGFKKPIPRDATGAVFVSPAGVRTTALPNTTHGTNGANGLNGHGLNGYGNGEVKDAVVDRNGRVKYGGANSDNGDTESLSSLRI
jgi:hypothetical protein